MGESPDKEALGGARAQTRAGAVDNEAADEDDALAQLRRFLSYLPDNAWEAPPICRVDRPAPTGARRRCCRLVPRDPRQPYDMRGVLDAGRATAARCSSSARRYGRLADHRARAPGRAARRRARLRPQALRRRPHRRRVGQARALRRPLRPVPPAGRATSSTSPGFVIGTEAERAGTIRRGARALYAVYQATRALGLRARAQGLRRRRRRAGQRLALNLRLPGPPATGARCRSRAASRPPTGASSRRPTTRRRCAPRSRRR